MYRVISYTECDMFIISCDSFIFRDSQTVDYCNSVLVSSIYSLYASSAKGGGFFKLKKNHIHAELMTPEIYLVEEYRLS